MVHYSETNPAFAHPLRKGILLSMVPGYALCIAGSVATHSAVPGLGLVPLSLSAVLSLITLTLARKKKKQERLSLPADEDEDEDRPQAPLLLSPFALIVYDVFFITFLLIVLVITWTNPPWWRSHWALNIYATVPMLFALFTHIYLGLLTIFHAVRYALKRERPAVTCPNCSTVIRAKKPSWFDRKQRRNGPYSALGEEDYRDSIEEHVSSRKSVDTPHLAHDEPMTQRQDKGKGTEEPSLSPVDE